jgi:hypothetical protein
VFRLFDVAASAGVDSIGFLRPGIEILARAENTPSEVRKAAVACLAQLAERLREEGPPSSLAEAMLAREDGPDRDGQTLQMARQYKNELLATLLRSRRLLPRTSLGMITAASQRPLVRLLPRLRGIRGIGFGAKAVQGRGESWQALRVYVTEKKALRRLSKSEAIPKDINGMPTDVVPVGRVFPAQVKCGTSVGCDSEAAGTLASLVHDEGNPSTRYLLSCNHVIAGTNSLEKGAFVYAPALMDGGNPNAAIAQLHRWVAIQFTNDPQAARAASASSKGQLNSVDAALAQILSADAVAPEIEAIGRVSNPPVQAKWDQKVQKHGRTSRLTVGFVKDIAADVWVSYDSSIAVFKDQLEIEGIDDKPFALKGDSGSLVVDASSNAAVGLLFAVGDRASFANPIGEVLRLLQATII